MLVQEGPSIFSITLNAQVPEHLKLHYPPKLPKLRKFPGVEVQKLVSLIFTINWSLRYNRNTYLVSHHCVQCAIHCSVIESLEISLLKGKYDFMYVMTELLSIGRAGLLGSGVSGP